MPSGFAMRVSGRGGTRSAAPRRWPRRGSSRRVWLGEWVCFSRGRPVGGRTHGWLLPSEGLIRTKGEACGTSEAARRGTLVRIPLPPRRWARGRISHAGRGQHPFTRAPETCVEVRSPSNTDGEIAEKVRAHLHAGATEVWIIDEEGGRRIYASDG